MGKVTLKSTSDEALSDEFLFKSNSDEALTDVYIKSNGDEAFNPETKLAAMKQGRVVMLLKNLSDEAFNASSLYRCQHSINPSRIAIEQGKTYM